MSNTNETHDQGCLDHNLDRLLELGEPAPGMPEDLKARIRSKLTEAGRESVKKRILPQPLGPQSLGRVACGRNDYGSRRPDRSLVWQLIESYCLGRRAGAAQSGSHHDLQCAYRDFRTHWNADNRTLQGLL